MKRILALLRNKRGSAAFIELAVLLLVILMIFSLAISYFGVYAKHNLVNAMAHEIARYVEVKGVIDSDTMAEFERLKAASGFSNARIDFDKHGRLQLEEAFTVTVTVEQRIGIGTIRVVPVTVSAVSTGRSEVYWKP